MNAPYRSDDEDYELIHYLSEFEDTDVPAVTIDGAPWLAADVVAKILDLDGEAKQVPHHMRCHAYWDDNDLRPFLSEAGVHRLTRRSELPVADRFSDWVVEDEFPMLRASTNRDTASTTQRTSRTRRRAGRVSTRGRTVA